MANLCGRANDGDSGTWSPTWDEMRYNAYVASATGTATAIKVKVESWTGTPTIKIALYDASRNLVEAIVLSPSDTGWRTLTLSASFAVTKDATYYLGAIRGSAGYCNIYDGGGTWNKYRETSGSYASPPASLSDPPDGTSSEQISDMYLDGTESGGGTVIPVFLSAYRRFRNRRPMPLVETWLKRNGLYIPQETTDGLHE